MHAFTVGGTTLNPTFIAGGLDRVLGNDIREAVQGKPIREEERGIKFSNQAGYVAEMSVIYFESLTTGGGTIPLAKTMTTPKLTAGFSRPLIIPKALHPGMPITLTITGVGTIKNPVF